MTDQETESLESLRSLYPHYGERELLEAQYRFERYIRHSWENYRWLKQHPES
jgi:hypothetical protein